MARAVRLDKLRALARLYCDQRPGGANAFVPDAGSNTVASVNDLINLALTELYDLLVSARGHEFYSTTATLAIVANTASYSLPATFYQMQAVILEWGNQNHESVEDLARVADRIAYVNNAVWSQWSPKAYRIRGTSIEFVPTPTIAVTCRLHYIPAFADLAADSDTFDGVNGWEKLVALRVAAEMRAIEEQPNADLLQLYSMELERIENMKNDREAAQPKRIQQVYPETSASPWPIVRGRPAP